jgi:hypothetical protein
MYECQVDRLVAGRYRRERVWLDLLFSEECFEIPERVTPRGNAFLISWPLKRDLVGVPIDIFNSPIPDTRFAMGIAVRVLGAHLSFIGWNRITERKPPTSLPVPFDTERTEIRPKRRP